MNLIEGEIIKKDGKVIFDCGEFSLRLPEDLNIEGRVILGFRPQHVEVSEMPREDFIEGKLIGIEKLGVESYAHPAYGDVEIIIRVPEELKIKERKIYWRPSLTRIYLFDPRTGELIYG